MIGRWLIYSPSTSTAVHPEDRRCLSMVSIYPPTYHSFIHSFINPSFHSFVHLYIHLFIHPPIYSFIYPPIFSSIYSSMVLICNMCMCMYPLQLGSTVTPPILWVDSCACRWWVYSHRPIIYLSTHSLTRLSICCRNIITGLGLYGSHQAEWD